MKYKFDQHQKFISWSWKETQGVAFHEQLKVVWFFPAKTTVELSKSLSFAESLDKIIRNSKNFVRISETLSQLRINNGSMQRIFSSLEWLSTIFPVFPQWFYSRKPQAKRLFIPHDQHFAILPKYHNTSKKYSEVSFIFTRAENLTVS